MTTKTPKAKRPVTRIPLAPARAETPVLVTTAHRGVFFGYTTDPDAENITLTRARNCIYWSSDVKGFLGLVTTGPTSGCRIGPAAPSLTLRNVTCVADVAPAAVTAWEAAPWTR